MPGSQALVGPDEGAGVALDREGDQEVWSWQLAFHLVYGAKVSFMVWQRAVAVAAERKMRWADDTGDSLEHGAVGFALAVDDGWVP